MAYLLHSPEIASLSGIGSDLIPFNLCSKPLSAKFRKTAGESSIPIPRKICRTRRIEATSIRNCASARECGAPLSGSVQNLSNNQQNYYVNAGHAIRTLRDELPGIFDREPSFGIYRDDITFMDPVTTFAGIENYKLIFWALRINARIFFKALRIDVISVWQPVENTVMVRWAVHGIPRVPWESYGRFDGTSEYKLDRNGKIFEHRVDNVATNSPPKFRVTSVGELIQALGCPSSARPTYFESLSSLANFMPFMLVVSSV